MKTHLHPSNAVHTPSAQTTAGFFTEEFPNSHSISSVSLPMENYAYSYPDSGDSSPRSREIDFENPPPWEDQQPPPNYKVKFMCSYGGKIVPRPHDNQLSYIGAETKILAVDRNIKLNVLLSKLTALCDADGVSFKYQFPGEDLDSLISVTSEDDLEHMMHEYDRLYRASARPARLRLFLFPTNSQPQSFGSSEGKSEKERFVEALNSVPIQTSPPPSTVAPSNNVDFLFGLERGTPPQPPLVAAAAKVRDQIVESAVREPELPVHGIEDRVIVTDPIQKHIQDLQRLRIGEEQNVYRRRSDDNLAGGIPGEYYIQKVPEKSPPASIPMNFPGAVPVPNPTGYWTEKQFAGGVYPSNTLGSEQPVYVIPTPAGAYHTPMARPAVNGPVPPAQGYYAVQRMPPEVYREQQVYNVVPPMAAPPTLPPQAQQKMAAYSEGYGMIRTTATAGVAPTDAAYAQVTVDNGMGRPAYYTAPGGVPGIPPPQYQASAAALVSADMRTTGALNPEGAKVTVKTTQASV